MHNGARREVLVFRAILDSVISSPVDCATARGHLSVDLVWSKLPRDIGKEDVDGVEEGKEVGEVKEVQSGEAKASTALTMALPEPWCLPVLAHLIAPHLNMCTQQQRDDLAPWISTPVTKAFVRSDMDCFQFVSNLMSLTGDIDWYHSPSSLSSSSSRDASSTLSPMLPPRLSPVEWVCGKDEQTNAAIHMFEGLYLCKLGQHVCLVDTEEIQSLFPECAMVTSVRHTVCDGCCKPKDVSDLKKCARCWGVRYCGSECQRQHWSLHKLSCLPILRPSLPIS